MGGQKPLACLNVVVLRLVVDKELWSEDSETLPITPLWWTYIDQSQVPIVWNTRETGKKGPNCTVLIIY